MLTKLLKYGSVFVVGIGLALVVAFFAVSPDRYMSVLLQRLVREAGEAGVRVSVGEVEARRIGVHARGPEFFIPAYLLTFQLDELDFDIKNIFWLAPHVSTMVKAYGGEINGEFDLSLSSSQSRANIKAVNIQIARHPQINGLGFTAGTLAASVFQALIDKNRLLSGQFNISLRGVNKPQPTRFFLPHREGNLPLTIPAFTDLALTIDAEILPDRLRFSRLELVSSLGSANGKGELLLDERQRARDLRLDGLINLTPAGVLELGPWVALASNGTLTPETQKFRVVTRGESASFRVKFSRAG